MPVTAAIRALPLLAIGSLAPALHEEPLPEQGLAVLHTVALQGFGLDAEHFERLWTIWPEPLRARAEEASPDGRRELLLDRYGLVLDPDRRREDGTPSDVPAAFAADGSGRWTLSCLACHSGAVAGTFVHGLGNNRFAFQTLVQDLVRFKIANGLELTEQERGMVFVPLGSSDGTTNAQSFSVVLSSFREPDLGRSERRRNTAGVRNHDLDAPPLWNVQRKTRLYLDGYIAKDPRVLLQFTLGLTNAGETIRGWEEEAEAVLAWIESLEPPEWQGAVDAELARTGRGIFDSHCAKCHGTYGADGKYPERVVPLDVVGTDPVRSEAMPRSFREWMATSWFTREGSVPIELDPTGYVAPPLDGLWATAPYFHNGSVPTLWHVLHPEARPAVWRHDRERDYDGVRVGLAIEATDDVPSTGDPSAARRWFDTRRAGKSAAGHTFPARLSEAQRSALLEYLKTL